MAGDPIDMKGLIREAYRIEGIGAPECRSIFLDWALSLPEGQDQTGAIRALLERHRPDWPDHPMTRVLEEGLQTTGHPRRRGGWRSRSRN